MKEICALVSHICWFAENYYSAIILIFDRKAQYEQRCNEMRKWNIFYCEVFKVYLKDAKLNLLRVEFNYCILKFCVHSVWERKRERCACSFYASRMFVCMHAYVPFVRSFIRLFIHSVCFLHLTWLFACSTEYGWKFANQATVSRNNFIQIFDYKFLAQITSIVQFLLIVIVVVVVVVVVAFNAYNETKYD